MGQLLKHLEQHAKTSAKLLNGGNRCPRCSTSFTLSKTLRRHVNKNRCRNIHVKEEQQEEEVVVEELATSDENVDDSEEMDMEEMEELGCSTSLFRFACVLCSRMFTSYGSMCRHRRLAHGRYGICCARGLTSRKRKCCAPIRIKNLLVGTHCHQDIPTFSANVHHNLLHFLQGKRTHLRSLPPSEDVLLKERVVQDTDAAEMAKNRWSWGETSYNIEELLRLDVPLQQALFRGLHLLHEPLDTSQCRAEAEEPVRSIISALQLQPNALKRTEKIQEEKEMKTESGEKAELDAVDPRPELSGEWTRPKSYICSPCGQSFSDFLILLEHQRCSHSNVWCTHIQLDASMQCVTGELSEQIVRSVSRST